uniref:NADH-ubiquinone oxidoreductase chain 2 n=1 Tax=Paphnutius ruficeps TaxID=1035836 RepID=A0A343K664_9HEMI|nr:NADH dehydrogenase subunit 2 [Paphnutius ruficeps]
MIFNSTKMLFFAFLVFSTIISLSSNNWFGGWMGLEINLMSFIPLMYSSVNYYSSESSMSYFIIQSSSSTILLLGIILTSMSIEFSTSVIIMFGLMISLGIAPFHMWVPGVMEGLSWFNCLILSSWQKVASLMLLSYSFSSYFMVIPILLSLAFGAIGGINQSSIKKLMAYSSINNVGWIVAGMMISMSVWLSYFIIYFLMIFLLMILFNKENVNYVNQLFMTTFSSSIKLLFSIMMMSLGGLPPLLGFLPKWVIIQYMIMSEWYFLILFMVLFSLITLFYYIRMCATMMLVNFDKFKLNKVLSKFNSSYVMIITNIFGFVFIMFLKFII